MYKDVLNGKWPILCSKYTVGCCWAFDLFS